MSEYKIQVYYAAPTYQDEPEGRARKAQLEEELGIPGEEISLGTGADFPGLLFYIDIADIVQRYGALALFALVKGKDIGESIAFYIDVSKRLARYVAARVAYLEWEGAQALAVEAVVEHLQQAPKSLILEGYAKGDYAGGGWDNEIELTEIGELPSHPGAFLPHHFQFEVDGGKRLKAIVNLDGVLIVELPPKTAA